MELPKLHGGECPCEVSLLRLRLLQSGGSCSGETPTARTSLLSQIRMTCQWLRFLLIPSGRHELENQIAAMFYKSICVAVCSHVELYYSFDASITVTLQLNWNCQVCTAENPPARTVCYACESPKGQGPPPVRPTDMCHVHVYEDTNLAPITHFAILTSRSTVCLAGLWATESRPYIILHCKDSKVWNEPFAVIL